MDKINQNLFEPSKPAKQLIKIRCGHCNDESEPKTWTTRGVLGVAWLSIGGIIPMLIHFISSNPYVCRQCDKRDELTKILNDKSEVKVKSGTKKSFYLGYSFVWVIIALLIIMLISGEEEATVSNVLSETTIAEPAKLKLKAEVADLFVKKQECAKYKDEIEKEIEGNLLRFSSLDRVLYSPSHNSCLYAYTTVWHDKEGNRLWDLGRDYDIVDYLTSETVFHANDFDGNFSLRQFDAVIESFENE